MVGELPELLQGIAGDARVTVRRGGEPRKGGKCVVYWMQRAERAHENPALEWRLRVGMRWGCRWWRTFL